jgi:putative membrane protein
VATPAHALDQGTRLALQRTLLAAERTLMAWVRTAFSMISFGFTMGKFLEYLRDKTDASGVPPHGGLLPRMLVLLGLVSLAIGVWEFRYSAIDLRGQLGERHRAAPVGIIAALVAVMGLLAFASFYIRLDFL